MMGVVGAVGTWSPLVSVPLDGLRRPPLAILARSLEPERNVLSDRQRKTKDCVATVNPTN